MDKPKFTLETFRDTMRQIERLGPLTRVFNMLPGLGRLLGTNPDENADRELPRIEAIIDSMTRDERRLSPAEICPSRRRRIAKGAGVEPAEVDKLLQDFCLMSGVMDRMAGMNMSQRIDEVHKQARRRIGNKPFSQN